MRGEVLNPLALALHAHAGLGGEEDIVGEYDLGAGWAALWTGQAELVGVFLAAGHTPVGDVSAAGIVVVGVFAHSQVMGEWNRWVGSREYMR